MWHSLKLHTEHLVFNYFELIRARQIAFRFISVISYPFWQLISTPKLSVRVAVNVAFVTDINVITTTE